MVGLEQSNSLLCRHLLLITTPSNPSNLHISHPSVFFSRCLPNADRARVPHRLPGASRLPPSPPRPAPALVLLPLHPRPFCSIFDWKRRAISLTVFTRSTARPRDPVVVVTAAPIAGVAGGYVPTWWQDTGDHEGVPPASW